VSPIRKARSFFTSDDGLTHLEYAILLALIAIAALAAAVFVHTYVGKSFGS
jgi:Flp pilus assembly pilin Flp